MSATTTAGYVLVLTDDERRTLRDVLEDVLKATEIELHRTEAFAARKVVSSKEAILQSLLRKVSEAGPAEKLAESPASRSG